jgi:hypothetical protein
MKMYAILSWIFLILSPVSFVGILYIVLKKDKGNIMTKLFTGIALGASIAFVMWFMSAYIGMNFY